MSIYTTADRLGRLVAATAKFQELTGEENATDAFRHVHIFGVDDEIAKDQGEQGIVDGDKIHTIPRAVVQFAPGHRKEIYGVATVRSSGTYMLTVELDIPDSVLVDVSAANRIATEIKYAGEALEDIHNQMMALGGVGESVPGETHLNVTEMVVQDGPWLDSAVEREHVEAGEIPNLYFCVWDVSYEG